MDKRNYSEQELLNNPSFIRWATGESEGDDMRKWNRWVKQSEENRQKALRAQKKLTGIRFTSPALPDIDMEWAKLRNDIRGNKHMRLISKNDVSYEKRSREWLSPLLKAAAVLLLGAFVGLALYMHQEPDPKEPQVTMHSIQTEYGEKKTIRLSDGSTVTLAASSQLSYKSNWLDQPVKRVSLQGEALFSIAPQQAKSHPKFVVETKDGSAAVWGTRFTVNTHGEGTQVVLEEGEVRVQVANAGRSDGLAELMMQPGEMTQFSKATSHIELKQVNPAVYTSWTTDELYFESTPFSVLLNRIERTYGVQVELQEPALLHTRLSGTIDFRSLDGLIQATQDVMDVSIDKEGQTLIIQQNNFN